MKKSMLVSSAMALTILLGTVAGAAAAESEAPQKTKSGDVITLTWLNHYAEAGKQAWVQSIKEKFEATYDNVELNIETVDADTHKTILQTKLRMMHLLYLIYPATRILLFTTMQVIWQI